MTNKESSKKVLEVSDATIDYAKVVAERFFAKRAKGKKPHTEIHLSQMELAAIIASAYHTGLQDGIKEPNDD